MTQNRITSPSSDILVRDTLFAYLISTDNLGGGAIFLSSSSYSFVCGMCTFDSCHASYRGGGVHVDSSHCSNIYSCCGKNCSAENAGQFIRSIVSTSNIDSAALISMTRCGSKQSSNSAECLITAQGKYFMHDINASDCHLSKSLIIAPEDSTGGGYVRYIRLTRSSSTIASRIINSLTVHYFIFVDNEITDAIFSTSGTPKCENSIFRNNKCTTLASGATTSFNNCYFDESVTGSISTTNCVFGDSAHTLAKINRAILPRCAIKIVCTYYAKRHAPGYFIYFLIMIDIS